MTDFAAENGGGAAGFLATIPELTEIAHAHKQGVSSGMIRRWLVEECGYAEERVPADSNLRRWLVKRYGR